MTYGNGLTRDRIVNCVAILLNFLQVAKRLRSMPMNSSSVEKQLWIDHFDSPDKLTQAVKGTRKPRCLTCIVLLSILYPIRNVNFPPFKLMGLFWEKKRDIRPRPFSRHPNMSIVIIVLFLFVYHYGMTLTNENVKVFKVIARYNHVTCKWKPFSQ